MPTPLPLLLALALALSAPARTPAQSLPASQPRFVGIWEGALNLPSSRLRLGFNIQADSLGGLRAVMTSVDENGRNVPSTVAVRGDTLIVTVAALGAIYQGALASDTIRGTFTQRGASLPLVLTRVAAVTVVVRPQDPKGPFPYTSREVSIESAPDVRLACTLLTPAGAGPFPAAVFATGSGPQNRNEENFNHRPFLVLADHLARNGVASLRCDDRGFARSTGNMALATSVDLANDAEAAVHFLRTEKTVLPARIGIIGHSEGGMTAPMVAARSTEVAFVVMLAGPAIKGDSILFLQGRLMGAAIGEPLELIQLRERLNRIAFGIAKEGGDLATMQSKLRTSVLPLVPTFPPALQSDTALNQLMVQMLPAFSPWFQYFLSYDPQPTLRRVQVPVLALNGTLDLQVPYKENLSAIETALKAGGNRDFRVVEMPGLNHMFQTAVSGHISEYGTLAETLSPAVLDQISRWILERSR